MEELLEYQLDGLIGDLKEKAPTLFQVLSAIVVRNLWLEMTITEKRMERPTILLCVLQLQFFQRKGIGKCAGCRCHYCFFLHMQKKVSNTFNVCMFHLIVFIIGLWSIESPQCECRLLSCTKVGRGSEHTVQSTCAEVD